MPVYTVSQIAGYLRASLQQDPVLQDLWISGEVSNLSASGAGHLYFTLKDAAGQLRCIMFRSHRGQELLGEGAAILAHGSISFYEARGDLRFYVDIVQPEGVGELALKLEQLKVKLEGEGLFDPTRKRLLPAFPRRIAVVTSPTGAVWHDIQNVVRRRYPLVELLLIPSPVQGEQAAASIVEGIHAASREPGVDVLIVARGGGSLEELWPFNEEAVARAIYASPVPVVSGVGHETDVTIADLVADLRAPTPSAAAELAVPDCRQLQGEVATWERSLAAILLRRVEEWGDDVDSLADRLHRQAPNTIVHRQRVDALLRTAGLSLHNTLALQREQLQGLGRHLTALDPAHVLARGYAALHREDTGEAVSWASQVTRGDVLAVTLQDGGFAAQVTGEPALRASARGQETAPAPGADGQAPERRPSGGPGARRHP